MLVMNTQLHHTVALARLADLRFTAERERSAAAPAPAAAEARRARRRRVALRRRVLRHAV